MKFSCFRKKLRKRAGLAMALIVASTALTPALANEGVFYSGLGAGAKVIFAADSDLGGIELAGDYSNGTYEGSGTGFKGEINLSVTISGNKITKIEEISQSETPERWSLAKALFETIVSENTTDVDAVSNATYSSNGIKEAVNDALEKAIIEDTKVFEKGSGSKDDPFVISSESLLVKFSQKVNSGYSYSGKYIELSKNLNLSGEWAPIGTKENPFAGIFDGNGFEIDGISISSSNTYAGFFGYLKDGAKVSNLNLLNVNIAKTAEALYSGAVAGYAEENAELLNIKASGIIEANAQGTDKTYAGGIAGYLGSSSVASNVYAGTSVSALSNKSFAYAGGAFGYADKTVVAANVYANISVSAVSESGFAYAGGIVGLSSNECVLLNSSADGSVYAEAKAANKSSVAGGIFGMQTGTSYNAFSSAAVNAVSITEGKSYKGGISGAITKNAAIINNYYLKNNEIEPYMFMGNISGFITDNVVGLEKSEFESVAFAETMNNGLKREKTASAALKIAEAENSNMGDLNSALSTAGKVYSWVYDSSVILSDEAFIDDSIDDGIFESGSGTEEDPYMIKTEGQLRDFAKSVTSDVSYAGIYIAMENDIDVSSEQWAPIGMGHYDFLGIFDGKNYKITGMNIGSKDAPYEEAEEDEDDTSKMTTFYGFFGVLGENAVVKNLGIEDSVISAVKNGNLYTGLLAGVTDRAYIDSCYANGYVYNETTYQKANTWAGGLIGQTIKGGIINSWTDVEVHCVAIGGLAETGAFIGMSNRSVVANCFAVGNSYGKASREDGNEGMPAVSSFIGVNGGKMANCYSTGDMKAESFSTYVGSVSGWATGIARQFISYYNSDAVQDSNGTINKPVISVGFMVSAGINDEGEAYDGTYSVGIEAKELSFIKSQAFADLLNSNHDAFPLDIVNGVSSNTGDQNAMGLPSFMKLKAWELKDGAVMPVGERVTTTYKDMTPVFEPDTLDVADGTYYGRAFGPSGEYIYVEMLVKDKQISEIKVTKHSEGNDFASVFQGVTEAVINSQSYAQESSDTDLEKAIKSAIAAAAKKSSIRDYTGYGSASASIFAGGEGTKEKPYIINTAKQLEAFAQSLNEDEHYEGKYIKLGRNISLSNISWVPAGGSGAYGFRGTFDGNGYVISDMTIGSETEPEMYCKSVGLFANLEAAKVKNLGIKNASIYHKYLGDFIAYAGILAGYYIENEGDGGYIDFCYAQGKINSFSAKQNDTAGLIGTINRGTISNCYANAAINSQSRDGYAYAGGICALPNRGLIINSYALGSITGTGNGARIQIGGITGMNAGAAINTFANVSLNAANTTVDVGGFSGRTSGISYTENAYYNLEAKQVSGEKEISPANGVGTMVSGTGYGKGAVISLEGKASKELNSTEFAQLLNTNKNDKELLSRTNEVLTQFGISIPSEITLRDFSYSSAEKAVVFKDRIKRTSSSDSWDDGSSSSSGGSTADTSKTDEKEEAKTEEDLTEENEDQSNAEENQAPKKEFSDTKNHWANDAISKMVERNIFAGVSENEFAPDASMTRAMFVSVIGRLVNADLSEENSFKDVEKGSWYSGYVGWALNAKIVSGISAEEFGTDNEITREQMVVMLYNLAKYKGIELPAGDEISFKDNEDVSDWSMEAVKAMVSAGVLSGRADNSLDPKGKATRAEAASMLVRFIEEYDL